MSNILKQEYVTNGNTTWFVSTINRESSLPHAINDIYAETLIWELGPEMTPSGRPEGIIVGQAESSKDCLRGHDMMVKRLEDFGTPEPALERE